MTFQMACMHDVLIVMENKITVSSSALLADSTARVFDILVFVITVPFGLRLQFDLF